jgi:hypothetical protein
VDLYGFARRRSGDVEGWWLSREDADEALAQVLGEAPAPEGVVYVEVVELDPDPHAANRVPGALHGP